MTDRKPPHTDSSADRIELPRLIPGSGLTNYPPPDRWDDWEEYDAKAWPDRVTNQYRLIPTTCFNCESACGLLAYVDKKTGKVRRFEGNPAHPGSRGRNCAKGPATINQMYDPERILHPLRRVGARGSGEWEQVSWDDALDDIAGRVRKALQEGRHDEIMYHVGRPGEDGFMERTLKAWGVDAHNSHTNICSAGARTGYAMWMGHDRPSPDFANAKFILLLSSHLETGHYFNPHAQRIMEGRQAGAKLATIDPRLSNTASMSDMWLSPWPGTEASILLAIARLLLEWDAVDHDFMRRWVNWEESVAALAPGRPATYETFIEVLGETYGGYTIEYAAEESGVPPERIEAIARGIADAGHRFSSQTWRSAGSGNLGGWQVARCLWFLHVLTGSVGTKGGTSPNAWNKFSPQHWNVPPPHSRWNELLWPREYPLSHHELSMLLPHFLKEGRGKLDVYFSRVYNPVWTNPDGFSWLEALTDESQVGLHVALTPIWSETAWFADYVLPMGVASERHDTHSYETHATRWVGFRQPVLRVAAEREGIEVDRTYETNPGEVWEETEFWIDLSWRIDPDGALGIKEYFASPSDPERPVSVDEYYGWMFENSVPGLPETAAKEKLSPLGYMRKYGAFEIDRDIYSVHESEPASGPSVDIGGNPKLGFGSPSRKLEWYSSTMAEWGWADESVPAYLKTHVYWRDLDLEGSERILLPIFRLPTLIHTRSGNAKYLYEISHGHPLWMNPRDADALGFETGQMIRITTDIGYFVMRVWRTEGIRPGVVAASHHMGRWRLEDGTGNERWSSALVDIERRDDGWMLRQKKGIAPFPSDDPDSSRIWWQDAGVHQNLAFPVHPDPISGMHAWHQRVRLSAADPGDRYGDVFVDTVRSHEIYREWLELTRPGPGPGGLRRPEWLARDPSNRPPMPTASESPAAVRAYDEANRWRHISGTFGRHTTPSVWSEGVPPVEALLIPETDPSDDLDRRAAAWGFTFGSYDFAELGQFTGALAHTEAEAWDDDDASVATHAYTDRRYLLADRLLPWAVPWLEAVSVTFPRYRPQARSVCEALLVLAEHHRPAPRLATGEGIYPPGYDGYGPLLEPVEPVDRLRSLWGGMVQLDPAEAASRDMDGLSADYLRAAADWERMAAGFGGSAACWMDLSVRARCTASAFGADQAAESI